MPETCHHRCGEGIKVQRESVEMTSINGFMGLIKHLFLSLMGGVVIILNISFFYFLEKL